MSQQQYNKLLSNMLKEKQALASLMAQLKGRQKRVCWSCKKFEHLAYNCRNKKEKAKMGKTIPQNKFEVLSSRVMQSGKGGQYIRRQEMEEARVVRCFKCGKKEFNCDKQE